MRKLVKGLVLAAVVAFGVSFLGASEAKAQFGNPYGPGCYRPGYSVGYSNFAYRPAVPFYNVPVHPYGINAYRPPIYGNSFYGSGISIGIGTSAFGPRGFGPGFGTGFNSGFHPGFGVSRYGF